MPHRDSLPVAEGMLHRPRVNTLIRRGLQQQLLVMQAGPGWGKTQALADYLQNSESRVLWLRLNGLDNMQFHFWRHFIQSLTAEFPNLAEELRALEFPDTTATQFAFYHLLEEEIAGKKHAIWVFDDFGEITDTGMRDFFSSLVRNAPDNIHIVLLSANMTTLDATFFLPHKHSLLLTKDIKFTRKEIAELFALYNTELETDELDKLLHYTEGWPLPLHLLAMQHGKITNLVRPGGELADKAITRLMEGYYASRSPELQELSLRLSLLTTFTQELALDLHEGDKTELENMRHSTFIGAEPSTGRLSFHNLYSLFLNTMQHHLAEEEKRRVWAVAAEYFLGKGDYFAAIVYYGKCKNHAGMLDAMRAYVRMEQGVNTHGITPDDTAFFLEHLNMLSPEEVLEHPLADYFRALLYLNTMELESAENLYKDLEQRLLERGTPDDLTLLGDVYSMWGALRMMLNKEDFGDYYRKAAGYLPQGSNLQSPTRLHTYNNHSFSMTDNQPGAVERMERAAHYGIPWANKVLKGGMSGMEHLYSAEAAYYTGRLDDAMQHAYRALYKAEPNNQHDLVCNSYVLLARIALMQGSYEGMKGNIGSAVDYADRYRLGVVKEIKDTALGWYYAKLQDYAKVPQSLLALAAPGNPIPSYGRDVIVYAYYLIGNGECARAIGLLEYPVGLYLTRGIWPDRITRYLLLAISYCRLGNNKAAVEAFWSAYDMTFSNGLMSFFAEGVGAMPELVHLARGQREYVFDPAWLDKVEEEAAAYAVQMTKVREAYWAENSKDAASHDNPLTKREMEVLQALSKGLTREEIASKQYVSINTVKTFIRSIYNKLDAANRAEAVSIAILRGYF